MTQEKKLVTIIVEASPHEWPKDDITYAEVVTLEVPDYAQRTNITYSVKYKNGHGKKPEGILAPGGAVKVKEGMVFSVSPTGQS
jgi:Xaa-Pro aminopeptidase